MAALSFLELAAGGRLLSKLLGWYCAMALADVRTGAATG
jgi:hypothetical protein